MDSLLDPDIIEAASSSDLGLLSLMILVLGIIALAFFRHSSNSIKFLTFCLLFSGVVGFGYSVKGVNTNTETADGAVPTEELVSVESTELSLTLITGTGEHSETDAIITVTIIGEVSSQAFLLDNRGDDRERGEENTYSLRHAADIGVVRELVFQISPQKGKEHIDDWYLNRLILVDRNRKHVHEATVKRWLGDGKTSTLAFTVNLTQ